MRLVDYVIVLVLIAAGIVLSVNIARSSYVCGEEMTRRDTEVLALSTRVGGLETSWQTLQRSRLAELEARVAALEGAPIREGAPAADAWSDADVAALRVGLQRIKVVEQRDREAQRFRQVVAHIIPDAEPAVREQAVALVQETIEAARADPENAETLRAELLAKLKAMFPEAIADRLGGLVPGGGPVEDSR